jgi:hypothetical protein
MKAAEGTTKTTSGVAYRDNRRRDRTESAPEQWVQAKAHRFQ